MKVEQVWLSKKDMCKRYGKDAATIWRWEVAGVLPTSTSFNGRPMWHLPTLVEHEKKLPSTERLQDRKRGRPKLKEAVQ